MYVYLYIYKQRQLVYSSTCLLVYSSTLSFTIAKLMNFESDCKKEVCSAFATLCAR